MGTAFPLYPGAPPGFDSCVVVAPSGFTSSSLGDAPGKPSGGPPRPLTESAGNVAIREGRRRVWARRLGGMALAAGLGILIPGYARLPACGETRPESDPSLRDGHLRWIPSADDLGRVAPTNLITRTLVLTNGGSEAVKVRLVRGTCSCIRIEAWPDQVEPGQAAPVQVEFRTSAFDGPFREKVVATSGDPGVEEVAVEIRGEVWRPVQVEPAFLVMPLTPDSPTNETGVVRIINYRDEPLALSQPEVRHRAFVAELQTRVPGKEFVLRIRRVAPTGSGNTFVPVLLKTSSREVPELEVTAFVPAPPAVAVTPSRIRLPRVPLEQAWTQQVVLRSTTDRRLVLSNATMNPAPIDLRLGITEREPGKVYDLQVVFPRGFTLPAEGPAEVRLESSHPQFRTIRIPVVPPEAELNSRP